MKNRNIPLKFDGPLGRITRENLGKTHRNIARFRDSKCFAKMAAGVSENRVERGSEVMPMFFSFIN